MLNLKIKKNNYILCMIIVIETIIIKFFQFKILPNKYFYDSKKILAIMNGNKIFDKSYTFTAEFYNKINFCGINNIRTWSLVIALIGVALFFIFFLKKEINIKKSIYIIVSFVFLNIYVFNLSKDFIQLLIFMFIYCVCINQSIKEKNKILIITLILVLESYFFRTYYLIMGVLVLFIYLIKKNFIEKKEKHGRKTTALIFLSFILFLGAIYILKYISAENYNILINVRNKSNIYRNSVDAVTMITDVLENSNFINFSLNYCINTFRILFPFELISKGLRYTPFIVYQLYFSYILLVNIRKLNSKNFIYICILLAFTMVSIIFEPDFGSVLRHQSVMILFVLELMNFKKEVNNNEKSNSYYTDL